MPAKRMNKASLDHLFDAMDMIERAANNTNDPWLKDRLRDIANELDEIVCEEEAAD